MRWMVRDNAAGRGAVLVCAGTALLAASGCQTPFHGRDGTYSLQQTISQAIERELASLPGTTEQLVPTTPASEVEPALERWREALDQIGPQVRGSIPRGDLGSDLSGSPQAMVSLSLDEAVAAAMRHNLSSRQARLEPSISEQDVAVAQAAFDAVWFTNYDFDKTDQPAVAPVLGSIPLGVGARVQDQHRWETGLRKRFESGAVASASTDLTRVDNHTPGINFFPDPSFASAVRLSVTQPLLRGFGSAVNTATIRLSRNASRRSVEALHQNLLQLALDTESAYWDLVLAWQDLAIRQWLAEVGVEVRDRMAQRREFDTRPAQYSDAVAVVEQRRADVIRARRLVRAASDRLKQLMNDPAMTIAGESVLLPSDPAAAMALTYNAAEAVRTGLANRPEVRSAALSIDDAAVREFLADNARLPSLAAAAEMNFFGLSHGAQRAYNRLEDGSFIDYALRLALEVPLGNRAAEAEYRKSRLQRSAAVLAYQSAVQSVVVRVKTALRDVLTNYELVQATRSFRVAQAENLRALQASELTMSALTPEFLNLKFQRQQTLAEAQRQESQALVNYSKAVAALYEAMGTALQVKGIAFDIGPEATEPTDDAYPPDRIAAY